MSILKNIREWQLRTWGKDNFDPHKKPKTVPLTASQKEQLRNELIVGRLFQAQEQPPCCATCGRPDTRMKILGMWVEEIEGV